MGGPGRGPPGRSPEAGGDPALPTRNFHPPPPRPAVESLNRRPATTPALDPPSPDAANLPAPNATRNDPLSRVRTTVPDKPPPAVASVIPAPSAPVLEPPPPPPLHATITDKVGMPPTPTPL